MIACATRYLCHQVEVLLLLFYAVVLTLWTHMALVCQGQGQVPE